MTTDSKREADLPKVYHPFQVEEKWYKYWLDKRYLHSEVEPERPRYCITIPPPNVTGSLHIGHALCYSIHDVLARWHRMRGLNTLILPGTDHAGIATQNKVEQKLADEGKTRFDLGRDKFVEEVWKWKEEYGSTIIMQLKRLGCSFDWERERFTMDPGYADAVLEAFVRLFDKGLIYRGVRVINWCPRCHTAISDIEVEYEEQSSFLYHIDYPLADGSGKVQVATTRPETMLGDTAVAVNPDDQRYTGIMGKAVILPIMNREIPIIEDSYVDIEFGTGAVKVTPAHDPNDFEMGLRHNLPQVVVIGPDGVMTKEAGKYVGLDRYEARKRIVEELRENGILAKMEEYVHSVGTCARCGTTIEPLLSEQWFMRMKELAEPAVDAAKNGEVKFIPDRYARVYLDWMENIKDWCISRQLWWGHRIPVWKCGDCGDYSASKTPLDACAKCGSANIEQDPDVLDTWFSSALWPFATLGWPKEAPELDYFYPTDVLITARDIIYLWVARMIFSSLEFRGQIPFSDVYIYATVMNEEGRRMSKSLGTGVDPLDLIERFGSDALRFALIQQAGKSQDMRFSASRVENVRNFGNKIWNISRFVLMNLEGMPDRTMARDSQLRPQDLKLEDRWILSRLNKTIDTVNRSFENYDMDDAARALYEFLWNEFADWYVELVKPRLRGKDKATAQYILRHVLETSMKLLHPVMPFITEEIWQALPHEGESIMVAPYPQADTSLFNDDAESEMNAVMEAVRAIRNLRAEIGLPPSKPLNVTAVSASEAVRERLTSNASSIKPLTRLAKLDVTEAFDRSAGKFVTAHIPDVDLYVEVGALLDVDKELERIKAELTSLEKELSRVNAKLGNEQFLNRAPAEIVEKERRIQAELADKKARLEERARSLGG